MEPRSTMTRARPTPVRATASYSPRCATWNAMPRAYRTPCSVSIPITKPTFRAPRPCFRCSTRSGTARRRSVRGCRRSGARRRRRARRARHRRAGKGSGGRRARGQRRAPADGAVVRILPPRHPDRNHAHGRDVSARRAQRALRRLVRIQRRSVDARQRLEGAARDGRQESSDLPPRRRHGVGRRRRRRHARQHEESRGQIGQGGCADGVRCRVARGRHPRVAVRLPARHKHAEERHRLEMQDRRGSTDVDDEMPQAS